MTTTGRDLRLERTSADVTVSAVAAQMGLSRQTLWVLERAAVVKADRANEYRRALLTVIEASR